MERYTLTSHVNGVSGCAISPDGHTIVSASYDRTIKVWEATRSDLQCTRSVDALLTSCAFSPMDRYVIAVGDIYIYILRLKV